MKKNQERALNAFAALESLPDGMLLEAEQALIAAEGGVIAPVKKPKPKGGFARFMRSGWSVAAMVSVVVLAVLVFVIRAGQTADGSRHTIEYSLQLQSNPHFTSSILVACARAAVRMHDRGEHGCFTMPEIRPCDLLATSLDEIRKHMI